MVDWAASWGNENVTAAATAVIAIFTIILVVVTNRQAKLTRQALELGRDEFIATHRPKIIARHFHLDLCAEGQPVAVWYVLVNVGANDAHINLVGHDVWFRRGREWEPPGADASGRELERPKILKNGESENLQCQSRQPVTAGNEFSEIAGDVTLCIVREVVYSDALGTRRRVRFERTYDAEAKRFVPSDDPDKEYSD